MAHHRISTTQPTLTLDALARIRQWHLAHLRSHPLERHLWDAVLTLWLMGWIGWLPAFILEQPLAYPLCMLGMLMPQLYVGWRLRAHLHGRLRCDWLELVH